MAEPTVEALALHLQEYWARSARRREPIIWADLARDTLALIGGPSAQPDLETLALMVHQGWQGHECTCGLDDLGPVEREAVTRIAGAALAHIGGRTEAEIKAEALEEAAEEFASRLPDGTGNGRAYNSWRVAELLRARAAAIRAGGQ